MANSIRPWIQMVGDFSSKYEDKMVPMLDLKIRMVTLTEEEDRENGIPSYQYQAVYFIFFKKSMARASIMDARSAMPEKTKRKNACNELMRGEKPLKCIWIIPTPLPHHGSLPIAIWLLNEIINVPVLPFLLF